MRALVLAVLAAAAGHAAPSRPAPADFARFSVLTPAGPAEPAPEVLRAINRLVWTPHVVAKGEYSADQIARRYGTTAMSLQVTNNDELYLLSPGRKLTVLNKSGQLYEVKRTTETLDRIIATVHRDRAQAFKYKQLVVAVNKLPGVALLDDYELVKGQRILLPNVTRSWDSYHFPINGPIRISSRFGSRYHPVLKRRRNHDGLDIAKPWGTPVYPARSGTVSEAGWSEGYGQLIVIKHADGATTRYGHLSKIHVKVGDRVQRGKTLIGRVGSTGLSTGPHLHFEVRDRSGRALNPGAKIGRR